MRSLIATILVLAAACSADIQFANDAYSISLRDSDGAILTLVDKADTTIATGSSSLWTLHFENETLDANAFMAAPWNGKLSSRWNETKDRLTLQYQSETLALNVQFAFATKYFDVSAEIVRCDRPIVRITVPAQINFPTRDMLKVVFPQRGAEAMGLAFLPAFFGDHRKSDNQTFTQVRCDGSGYAHLYGGSLNQLADKQAMAPLAITAEGKKWFSPEAIAAIEGKMMSVNRPPVTGQYTLALVENQDGPALSAHDFGGKGLLFRIAGSIAEGPDNGRAVFTALMNVTMQSLAKNTPDLFKNKKVAIIALRNGPTRGGWTAPSVPEWQEALANAPFWRQPGSTMLVIDSAAKMRQALDDDDIAMILNPYGEWFPGNDAKQLLADLDLLRDYVRRGGIWWEVGGYSFYYVLEPAPYITHEVQYPSGVADFIYVDYLHSGIALFGIQPMMRKPWDRERVAVPASLKTWGDPAGAAISHAWNDAIEPGMTWQSPLYRCQFGFATAQPAMEEYARVNEIAGSLEAKVRNPEVLDKLKNAVLVRMGGATADIQIQTMASIPAPNIIHFTEYLHGGFDKQYPDHLPPRASWGSSEDLSRFYRAGHDLGHLMMPYTNTSWWCIDPKGPTFEREGEAPLAFNRDGKLSREQYAENAGYGLCFWHPAVQAIHREVRHDMSVTYPSDIILQDQVGARAWRWNYHALEPRKASAMDGMHSLAIEDAEHVPLATEDGHDRVVNFETMLSGCAWGTVPARGKYSTRHTSNLFPRDEWQFFPILSYLSHQQCLFTTHDLGHFIEEPDQLCYALAFGYNMSYRWALGYEKNPARMRWLHWLDALQKTVGADYAGKKLLDFSYPRHQLGLDQPHQVTCTRFADDILIIANLEGTPSDLVPILAQLPIADAEKRWLEQHRLPPYGFYITSPRAKAATLENKDGKAISFALAWKKDRLHGALLGRDSDSVPAFLPAAWQEGVSALINEDNRREELRLSQDGAATVFAWQTTDQPSLLSLPKAAPATLADSSRIVAVVALDALVNEDTRQTIARWLSELPGQFQQSGLQVVAYRSIPELVSALKLAPGKERPFAIINPGGESYYGDASLSAHDMLDLMRNYVRTGGIWWQAGGGYPLYSYSALQADGTWKTTPIHNAGANAMGFTCAMRPVSDAAQPIALTDAGKEWLDSERAAIITAPLAGVQRPIEAKDSPLVLVKALQGDDGFLEAARCGGAGFFFHLGGFSPPWPSAINSVGATVEFLFLNPWPTPTPSATPKIWRLAQ